MEEVKQGTDEWKKMRLGKVTASRIPDVLAKPTTAAYKNYRAQLVAERLTGVCADGFINDAMQRGTELEPDARSCYEFVSGLSVDQVDFCDHETIENTGASPDGMIFDEDGLAGLVEIKCRTTALHIDYLLTEKIDSKALHQMNWQMACTGAKWVDFVSYDPRLEGSLQLFIKRVERDNEKIAALEVAVIDFLKEVDSMASG